MKCTGGLGLALTGLHGPRQRVTGPLGIDRLRVYFFLKKLILAFINIYM